MNIHFPLRRHSRAGGNPANLKTLRSRQTKAIEPLRGLYFCWIPAYAGMTARGDI
jgi:hypothetical protein